MYVKKNYGFLLTLAWSIKPMVAGALYATAIVLLSLFIKAKFSVDILMPWQPISLLGISVAFYLGFKNNASYERLWEARKIWGGIVNSSRSFGIGVLSFLSGDKNAQKQLIYRHIAWMTATRYQLRSPREWEHIDERNKKVQGYPACEEENPEKLFTDLLYYIDPAEVDFIKSKSNKATQLIKTQSQLIENYKTEGKLSEFQHIHLHQLLDKLYEEQGKSERIKNFPFPRQYASAALWNTSIFAAILPFGLIDIFNEQTRYSIWLTIPVSAIVTWVFFLMEKIGDYSENPFEGGYNDVPITTISRAIEIDLREMMDDQNIPKPIPAVDGYQL
jgi:ion channel-forming bestrophin family protein